MNNKEIYKYLHEIRMILDKIEAEVSDPKEYNSLSDVHYNDVVWYYQNDNDDDEEGL